MKTNINFYTDDLKPKVYYLTLTNVAIVALAGLLVMTGWFAQVFLTSKDLSKQKALAQTQLGYAQEELVNYQQALVKHNDNASFNDLKFKLEKEIQSKKTLLTLVNLQSSKDAIDYSVVMHELTEHHDHNVWLQDFSFNRSHVTFHGYALESKSVTQWMSYLQATDSFKGREFSSLNIKAIDEQVLEFKASTVANGPEEESAL